MLRTLEEREALRQIFRPEHVELLFVGESPPASGRFFYSGNSGLYRAMRDAFRAVDPSINDENFLDIFKGAGCYLTDLCSEPVDHLDLPSRRIACRHCEESLSKKIVQLQPVAIAPVLHSIADNVARAASLAGWCGPTLQLPYPGRWVRYRKAFIEALVPTIAGLIQSTGSTPH